MNALDKIALGFILVFFFVFITYLAIEFWGDCTTPDIDEEEG